MLADRLHFLIARASGGVARIKMEFEPGAADAFRPGHRPTVAAFSRARQLYRHASLWLGLAFYENVTVLGDGTESGVRAVLRRAGGQARLWPKQNHLLLAVLSLVAGVLWLNAAIAVFTAPQLLKMFLGIETTFSRSGIWSMFNTTFLAVTVALAWLALDPLVKAVYTLRCFRGEARQDGADLLAELSLVRAAGKLAVPPR